MSKSFRPWRIDETQLLPASVQDFVGKDHLARLVVSLVREHLSLAEISASYSGEKGQPPYDPAMMTALLLYSYCSGVYSSRRIAKACRERTDFLMIVALDPPDFRTVSEFRRRHLAAAAADAAEDRAYGTDKRGDELPDWVADKAKRLAKIREAKAALEAEAKAAAEAKARAGAAAEEQRRAAGRKKPGKKARPPSGAPDGKAQRNFTDPESRIMKSKDGFVQAYNAQAAVDGTAQVIVAHGLTNCQSDQDQLAPRLDDIQAHLGRRPKEASADAGYCSEANFAALEERNITGYVAVARAKHPDEAKRQPLRPLTQAMQRRLKRGGWRSRYRLRKQIVEPVFGQIKAARGFRQFLMRGIEKVTAEWAIICTAHNILKLAKAYP